MFATEREAAIYVDRWLIKNGLEPVILKRVWVYLKKETKFMTTLTGGVR
jgi:hypothetical protein